MDSVTASFLTFVAFVVLFFAFTFGAMMYSREAVGISKIKEAYTTCLEQKQENCKLLKELIENDSK